MNISNERLCETTMRELRYSLSRQPRLGQASWPTGQLSIDLPRAPRAIEIVMADANQTPATNAASTATSTSLNEVTLNPIAIELVDTTSRQDDPSLVHVAAAVYSPTTKQAGPWRRLSDEEITQAGLDPIRLSEKASGFEAGLYRKDDGKKHALAFAGTVPTSGKDWYTDLAQGAGLQTAQYAQAVALAKNVANAFDKANVVVTGHSLGGGLATAAGAAADLQAVVFNPAGVHRNTFKREGLDPDKVKQEADQGKVRNYIVKGEILNTIQDHVPLIPKAIGQRTLLSDPQPLGKILKWMPGAHTVHSGGLHTMQTVSQSMAIYEKAHTAFFNSQAAQRAEGGMRYTGELLSVPSGRTGDVTQQVGENIVKHERSKLAAYAGMLKPGSKVEITYNDQATIGVVKRARTQTRSSRIA